MFGLTSSEGNRGEDVKEYYFYLDARRPAAYMKILYKYPQAEYPVRAAARREPPARRRRLEFELLDTGVFDDDRYFDVVVEYAKAGPEDICIRIEAFNRGARGRGAPRPAALVVPEHLGLGSRAGAAEPVISSDRARRQRLSSRSRPTTRTPSRSSNLTFDYRLGARHLYAAAGGRCALHQQRDERRGRLGTDSAQRSPHTSRTRSTATSSTAKPARQPGRPRHQGGAALPAAVPSAHGSTVWQLRLTPRRLTRSADGLSTRSSLQRRAEADEFYEAIHPPKATTDEKLVQRQALAGMLWTKQIYLFDVERWLDGDNPAPPPPRVTPAYPQRPLAHLNSMRILSMPDKWEYPWFAAWDLAFHCVALALVDPDFAKENLWVLLFEQFQHPNGQIPAYEWEFSDLNPPVHAWACWRVYNDRERRARARPIASSWRSAFTSC